jgi:hypothetical protein
LLLAWRFVCFPGHAGGGFEWGEGYAFVVPGLLGMLGWGWGLFKGWEEGFGKRGVYCVMGGGAGDDSYDTPFNGNGWVEYRGFECLYANL